MSRSSCIAALRLILRIAFAIVLLALYLAGSTAAMQRYESSWTNVDAVYFTMATLSTVGYGDFSPSSRMSRLITVGIMFIGVFIIFPVLAGTIGMLVAPITSKGRALLDRMLPPKLIDIDGDGSKDYPVPGPAPIYYTKKLLPSFVLVVAVQLLSALVFVFLEGPAWKYDDALYHCLITVTTVGYGDIYIATQGGRIFACVHMLIGVVLFAELVSTIDAVRSERALAKQRLAAVKMELTPGLMRQLTDVAQRLRPLDDDPSGLNELEFVIAMLLKLGFLDRPTLVPFLKQFRKLDVDPDGRLTARDVEMALSLQPTELKELRRRNTEAFNLREKERAKKMTATVHVEDYVDEVWTGASPDATN